MLSQYFILQLRRLDRALRAFGVHPIIGKILLCLLFIGISATLFYKIQNHAIWLYLVLMTSILVKLSAKNRIDKIGHFFTELDLRKIRLLENTLVAIPFILYALYEGQIQYIWTFPIVSVIFIFIKIKNIGSTVIPTPYRKIPFENIVGFRKNLWIILLLIGLYIQGINVANYNIGIAVQGLMVLVFVSFYFQQERDYFVWIHAKTTKEFLFKKIAQGVLAISVIHIPLAILNLVFQPTLYLAISMILIGGYLLIIFIILAKYSAYPLVLSLPHGIILLLCLIFPPLLLITIPFLYQKANKSLKPYLHD